MHILYLITQQDTGGAQKYVLDMAEHFKGSVAAGSEGTFLRDKTKTLNIPFYLVPHLQRSINPYADFRALVELILLIRRLKPDIVHTNSSKAGILGTIAAYLCRTPTVFTAHGFQYLEPMNRFNQTIFWLCERACRPLRSFIITVSEADRSKAIKDKVVREKTSLTIYHGITPPEFYNKADARESLGLKKDVLYICCLANFYPVKNIEILLTAFAKLLPVYPHTRLALIGEGPEKAKLYELTRQLGIASSTDFLGQIPNAARYLKAFDIFALTSVKEGFPYAILEAMAAGLPIVASAVGGMPEAVNTAAMLINPTNANSVALALAQLHENPGMRTSLGEAAIKRFEIFSLNAMFDATAMVYAKINTGMRSTAK